MEDESGGQDLGSPSNVKLITFAEIADELCPVFMSMGMSYNDYWYGDYTQLQHYSKAFEMQRERANYDAWLQGAYVYDALCMVSPILHAFAKNGTKPTPYHKEPYGMKFAETDSKTVEGKPEKTTTEIQALNASAKFASIMTQWNKQFENKGGEANGSNDRSVTD